MALTYLTSSQANAAVEAMFPSTTLLRQASAGSTSTLTLTVSDSLGITPGMTVTGTGITGSTTVSSVNNSTGVVTLAAGTPVATDIYTFSQAQWGSLHTATPGTTGASECTDANYTRQQVSWTAPGSGGFVTAGQKANSGAVTWPAGSGSTGFAASQTITYFGFRSASGASGGTWLGGGSLTSVTIPIGGQLFAAIGAITLTVSG